MIALGLLKQHLRIGATNTDQDLVLAQLEESATAFIEAETNRYFGPVESVTWYLDGAGHARLWLPDLIDPDQTITVNERANPGSDATTITAGDSDGYLSNRPSRLVPDQTQLLVRKQGHVWYRGYEYEVAATRGYAMGDEPEDIRKLVMDLAVHWYNNRSPAEKGTIVSKVPLHVQAGLTRWRQRPWA